MMRFHLLFLLFGAFSCAIGRYVKPDGIYWFSSYTESATDGPFSIRTISDDGKYIELYNWSEERQFLNGWTIKQKVRGETTITYTFDYCSIRPGYTRKIVANNWTKEADATDFVATDVEKWATGRDIQTYLYTRNNTLVAKFIRDRASSTDMLR